MKTLRRLWKEEAGQDLIEYALLVALIALTVVTVFPKVSAAITNVFSDAVTQLNSAT